MRFWFVALVLLAGLAACTQPPAASNANNSNAPAVPPISKVPAPAHSGSLSP